MQNFIPQGNVEECIISSPASRSQTNKKVPKTGPLTHSELGLIFV